MKTTTRLSSALSSLTLVVGLFTSASAHAQAYPDQTEGEEIHAHQAETAADDAAKRPFIQSLGCITASKQNILVIDEGNRKLARFLEGCAVVTGNSPWCAQLVRPNPASQSTFSCTYGDGQEHFLVNPDEKTWPYAWLGAKLVSELQAKGIGVAQIYNWWRPEPYNKNVGGAAGRHPFGTSVDVRMKTMNDMELAHKQLCQWRAKGRIRAVGYYGSTGLHFGIGDKLANTWGKSCPSNYASAN